MNGSAQLRHAPFIGEPCQIANSLPLMSNAGGAPRLWNDIKIQRMRSQLAETSPSMRQRFDIAALEQVARELHERDYARTK